jgi:hypothetical protein
MIRPATIGIALVSERFKKGLCLVSVNLLLVAVAAAPQTTIAIVSFDLFIHLQAAAELNVTYHSVRIPADPQYGEIIDRWLASEGIDPNQPISVPDYTLKSYPDVHVCMDHHFGMALSSSGQGSFKLY